MKNFVSWRVQISFYLWVSPGVTWVSTTIFQHSISWYTVIIQNISATSLSRGNVIIKCVYIKTSWARHDNIKYFEYLRAILTQVRSVEILNKDVFLLNNWTVSWHLFTLFVWVPITLIWSPYFKPFQGWLQNCVWVVKLNPPTAFSRLDQTSDFHFISTCSELKYSIQKVNDKVIQNKLDFLLKIYHNLFYCLRAAWNLTILGVDDFKSYDFSVNPNSNPFLLMSFIPPEDSLDQSLEFGAGLNSKHRLHLRSISFPLKNRWFYHLLM